MKKQNKLNKTDFDKIIKKNLIETGIGQDCFTYRIGTKTKEEYYTKTEFNKFVDEMKSNYYKHYLKFDGNKNATANKGGLGGELKEKMGRYGLTPPKMASVASSSRFCYLALRDGSSKLIPDRKISKDEVEFEKECKIFDKTTHSPQLDAYISSENFNVYVEAKCHEIFDSHKVEFKNKYWECFKDDEALKELLSETYTKKDKFQIPLKSFGISKKSARFDIKQLVCHLLGIAKQNGGKPAKLVYMFFKPCCNDSEVSNKIDVVFNELSEEIKSIFTSNAIQCFCENNNIELAAIALYSQTMQNIDSSDIINLLN